MQWTLRRTFVLPLFLWVAILVHNTALSTPTVASATPAPEVTPPPSMTRAASGWLILPELPITATQADYGAEIYRLVCQDCHGEERLGLTPKWIAAWPEESQNCWQSKCHAPNHPPEGFDLPRYVPPVGGPNALGRFATALDLYEYIRQNMPWHNPASLTDEQYWQLAAFLIREQDIDSMTSELNYKRASNLQLHPDPVPTVQPEEASAAQQGTVFWWATVAGGAVVVTLVSLLVYSRRSVHRQAE